MPPHGTTLAKAHAGGRRASHGPATGHGRPNALPHAVAYVGQRLFVLEQQEPVALFRAGILQDQGKVLDVPQRQAVLQCHHHILQTPQTGLGARHWPPTRVGAGAPLRPPLALGATPVQDGTQPLPGKVTLPQEVTSSQTPPAPRVTLWCSGGGLKGTGPWQGHSQAHSKEKS